MAKSLLLSLLIFSGFAGKAQTDACLNFKLTVEVRWLETDEPLKGWNVAIEGIDKTTIQNLTNDSGYVFVDPKFLEPECVYTITVSHLDSIHASIHAQVSTIGIINSRDYYLRFKLRNIYCNYNPFPRLPPKD